MIFTRKTLLFLIPLTIGIFCLNSLMNYSQKKGIFKPGNKNYHVQKLLQEGSCVAEDLQENLTKIHDMAIEGIKTEFEITDQDWQERMDSFEYAKSQNPILANSAIVTRLNKKDHPLIKLAKQCLIEAGINPKAVQIACVKKKFSPACAYQNFTGRTTTHTLEIDLDILGKKPLDVQKAILNHEIMHLVHYDPLEAGYITTLVEDYGYTKDDYKYTDAMIQYCQQREFRADLMASCNDIAIAQAFQKDFEQDMKKGNQDDPKYWITHPSDKQRYQEIGNLISYLEIENNLKLNDIKQA